MENKTRSIMKKIVQLKGNGRVHRLTKRGLSLLVAATTVVSLVMPAFTLEGSPSCGIKEHTHADACYEQVLTCGQEETAEHTHTDACYEEELTCEISEHTHTGACYQSGDDNEKDAATTEDEANKGTDTNPKDDTLNPGDDNNDDKLTDADKSEDSSDGENVEENPSEEETEQPDVSENDPPVEEPEEQPDPEADVESPEDWEEELNELELTGIWGEDLLSVAFSQMGYSESVLNYIVADDGTHKGYTRYGEWKGDRYADWNALFVEFCLRYAEIPEEAFPQADHVEEWIEALSEEDIALYRAAGDYTPQEGDLVFLAGEEEQEAVYVGIVSEVEKEGTLWAILGDYEDRVQEQDIALYDERILGYGELPENPEIKIALLDMEGELIDEGTCGTDAYWRLSGDGVLTIYGKGAITGHPWDVYKDEIGKIVIEEGITAISATHAFYECRKLQNVELPDSLTSIARNVFQRCSSLREIKIPSKVETINTETFNGCSSLRTISFSDELSTIKGSAFAGCSSLKEVVIPDTVTKMEGSVFQGCGSLEKVHLPKTLEAISIYTFYNCRSLKEVDWPEELGDIGNSAFWYCESLKEVNMPDTVTNIDAGAFNYCFSLEKVHLSEGLVSIGNSAFSDIGYLSSRLTEINMPKTLKRIGNNAFSKMHFKELELPEGLESIGKQAFENCGKLTKINIPNSVTSIGAGAFRGCSSLQVVEFGDEAVAEIKTEAFKNCSALREVTIPAGVEIIEDGAFNGCSKLGRLTIEEGEKYLTIGERAFASCGVLKEASLPDRVISIGQRAFDDSVLLSEINLPSSLQLLGYNAIPNNVEVVMRITGQIEKIIGDDPSSDKNRFSVRVDSSVPSVEKVTLDNLYEAGMYDFGFKGPNVVHLPDLADYDLPQPLIGIEAGDYYADEKGVLYRINDVEDGNSSLTLVYCPPEMVGNYRIPGKIDIDEDKTEVKVIGVDSFAFSRAQNLVTLEFETPDNIIALDNMAFAGAGKLESINGETTEKGVRELFRNCTFFGNSLVLGTKIESLKAGTSSDVWSLDELNCGDFTLKVNYDSTYRTNKSFEMPGEVAGFEPERGTGYTGQTASITVNIGNKKIGDSVEADGIKDGNATEEKDLCAYVYVLFTENNGSITNISTSQFGKEIAYKVGDANKLLCTYKVEEIEKGRLYRYAFEGGQLGLSGDYPIDVNYGKFSRGGNVLIWAGMAEKGEENQISFDEAEKHLCLTWKTEQEGFVLNTLVTQNKTSIVGTQDAEGEKRLFTRSVIINNVQKGNALEQNLPTFSAVNHVGSEYAKSINFTNTIILPEGMRLSKEFAEAIKSNDYICAGNAVYTNSGQKILEGSGALLINGIQLISDSFVGVDKLEVMFELPNKEVKGNIPQNKLTPVNNIQITFAEKAFEIDLEWLNRQTDNEKTDTEVFEELFIQSKLQGTVHYLYSTDVELEPKEQEVKLKAEKKDIVLSLIRNTNVSGYWYPHNSIFPGEAETFTITASNPDSDLPEDNFGYLRYKLDGFHYMSSENIADLFTDDSEEHRMTVIIEGARLIKEELRPEETTVFVAKNGERHVLLAPQQPISKDAQLTANKTKDDTAQQEPLERKIVITWGEGVESDKLKVCLDDREGQYCTPTKEGIQSVLNEWGYYVTVDAFYTIEWSNLEDEADENGEKKPRIFYPGDKVVKVVHATNKDYFMLLTEDQDYFDNKKTRRPTERLYALQGDKNNLKKLGKPKEDIKKENSFNIASELSLSVSPISRENGKQLEKNEALKDGDVIRYSFRANYYGAFEDVLPMEAGIDPGQILLAEVKANQGKEWTEGLEVWTSKSGIEYYLLEKEGKYRNVSLQGKTADTVAVTGNGTERKTVVRWYLYEEKKENPSVSFCVRTGTGDNESPVTSYGFTAWLNDHETHRIYQYEGVSLLKHSKEILDEKGQALPADKTGIIHEGDKITYRLSLSTDASVDDPNYTYTLTGNLLEDILPFSTTNWEKGTNVKVEYDRNGATLNKIENADSWDIEDATELEYAGQQKIQWGDDFKVTLSRTPIYINVTLTYPKGEKWEEYCKEYADKILVNNFVRYGAEAKVYQVLAAPTSAVLRKGVLETGCYKVDSNDRLYDYEKNDTIYGRQYYSNDEDAFRHTVDYYAVIHNNGPARLYLSEIQDILPEGFTFDRVLETSLNRNLLSGKDFSGEYEDDYIYKYCKIGVEEMTSGHGENGIRFVFKKNNSVGMDEHLNYDEALGMFYLNSKEAIAFSYRCYTNEREVTPEIAVNAIAMPYYNHNEGELRLEEQWPALERNGLPNDGLAGLYGNKTLIEKGFILPKTSIYKGTPSEWLYSDVSITRGGIKPGVQKNLYGYMGADGEIRTDILSGIDAARPLVWEIQAENENDYALNNYVLTDIMQQPYAFTGEIKFEIKNKNNDVVINCGSSNSYFIKFIDGNEEDGIKFQTLDGTKYSISEESPIAIVKTKLYQKGRLEPVETEVALSLKRDDVENWRLDLHISDKKMAIPAHGSIRMQLTTVASGSIVATNVNYSNVVYFTPLSQKWDAYGSGKKTDAPFDTPFDNGEEARYAVFDSSSVYIGGTSAIVSEKTVAQTKGETKRLDNCVLAPREAVMSEDAAIRKEAREFTYTLSVKPVEITGDIEQLVVIDGLPRVGDHTEFWAENKRMSAFNLCLAENPDFTLILKEDGKDDQRLNGEEYSIQLSKKDIFTDSDWSGEGEEWENISEEKMYGEEDRSLRLIVPKATIEKYGIDEGSELALSFNTLIDGDDLKPATVAWNSFGYAYQIGNILYKAAPPEVGILIPGIPRLEKVLKKQNGNEFKAEEDMTCRFLVYQGIWPALQNNDSFTEEQLKEALDKQQVNDFAYVELPIKAGESSAELDLEKDNIRLGSYNETEKSFIAGDENAETLIWEDGKTYTIIELPIEDFYCDSFNNTLLPGRTFTYSARLNEQLTCINVRQEWELILHKVDKNKPSQRLKGAMFALYSPNESDKRGVLDQMISKALLGTVNDLSTGVDKEYVDESGKTWYLMSVEKTDENGMIDDWKELLREEYIYREIKAPAGYYPDMAYVKVKRPAGRSALVEINVPNEAGAELPRTGGVGVWPYMMSGIVLMLGALLIVYRKEKHKILKK